MNQKHLLLLIILSFLALTFAGCGGGDSSNSDDTADTSDDTADTSDDTADTSVDTADTSDDTADTSDDTADTSDDTADTSDDTATDSGTEINCDDNLECTEDILTADDTCKNIINNSYCVIDDTCFANGDENPENPCEICDSVSDTTGWTAKAEDESCGFCRQCSADAKCEKMPTCCDLSEFSGNTTACGNLTDEEILVEPGCGMGQGISSISEIYKSYTSTSYACQADGTWKSTYGTGGIIYDAYNQSMEYKITWNANCPDGIEDIVLTCEKTCNLNTLPWTLQGGLCASFISNNSVSNGATVGMVNCEKGESTCAETTVTCENSSWVDLSTTDIAAPASTADNHMDRWFSIKDGVETELKSEVCLDIKCQAILLADEIGSKYFFGNCSHTYSSYYTVDSGQIIHPSYSYTTPTSGSGSSSDSYKCNSDGSWSYSTSGIGGGGGGTNPGYIWYDSWYVDTVQLYSTQCNDSCSTSWAPNYTYISLNGLSITVPHNESYSRCVYENGNLVNNSVYGCTTDADNVLSKDTTARWTDFGTDSTCPATVAAFNKIAASNDQITACATDNCVVWKTTYGNMTKTTDIL
ncbi:MAG: hypothetical protein JXR91_01435 [Deltaproteobacteria bacterium]|nr:hypothetical protein [Deltaproteobacteria bacterium]